MAKEVKERLKEKLIELLNAWREHEDEKLYGIIDEINKLISEYLGIDGIEDFVTWEVNFGLFEIVVRSNLGELREDTVETIAEKIMKLVEVYKQL